MADDDSTTTKLSESSGSEQQQSDLLPQVPGGESKAQPPEPNPPTEITDSDMGCTTSRAVDDRQRTTSDEKMDTDGDPVKTDKGNDGSNSNTSNQGSKRKKKDTKSGGRPGSGFGSPSDDEENNENPPRQSGPLTRSSVVLSNLHIKFENSDDENDSRYSSWAKDDVMEYRQNYPNARDDKGIDENLRFYKNELRSHPDGDYIEQIHKNWFGDYRKLEFHHGYIQWLFPLQERGLNWSAQPLQKHEIESIKKDKKALKRILTSYQLMLDFYGFKLVNEETGEIRRLPKDEYKDRFRNLNTSSHNYLRITRILKCLGEFTYEHLKFPFLEAILRESITEDKLRNCLRSCKDYWIGTLRSAEERRAIRQYARELVEYRNKGMSPPSSHRAIRPVARQISDTSTGENPNSY